MNEVYIVTKYQLNLRDIMVKRQKQNLKLKKTVKMYT